MHQRIFRDVEAERLEIRARFLQVLDQKTLAGADIEHPVPGLQAKMRDHVLGDRQPAPVIAIAAIAGVPRTVEIFTPVLPGDTDILFILRDCALLDIALRSRIAAQQIDLGHPDLPPKIAIGLADGRHLGRSLLCVRVDQPPIRRNHLFDRTDAQDTAVMQ